MTRSNPTVASTQIHAFADEYGNNSFEFETQGSHFIVASVIVKEDKLAEAQQIIESVRKKHFQTGEIKSSKVAGNYKRRINILRDLIAADFSIYAVVVDKRKLMGEGFKYKKPFYKFLNNLVYKELFKTFPKLVVTVDEHGDNDFMRQFKKYVEKKHIRDLFGGADFGFSQSPNSPLIQLADFIAGTLARCYDERFKSEENDKFLDILENKITSINAFPSSSRTIKIDSFGTSGIYNKNVAEMALLSAQHFVDNKIILDQDDIDQVNCAKLLMLYFTTFSIERYLSAKELIQHLNAGRPDPIEVHHFRTKIIAKLRDKGVLVVSSATGDKKGYKLPSSLEDIYKFVSHGNNMIMPILSRIKIFRDQVKLASLNEIDILDKPEFEGLQQIIK